MVHFYKSRFSEFHYLFTCHSFNPQILSYDKIQNKLPLNVPQNLSLLTTPFIYIRVISPAAGGGCIVMTRAAVPASAAEWPHDRLPPVCPGAFVKRSACWRRPIMQGLKFHAEIEPSPTWDTSVLSFFLYSFNLLAYF